MSMSCGSGSKSVKRGCVQDEGEWVRVRARTPAGSVACPGCGAEIALGSGRAGQPPRPARVHPQGRCRQGPGPAPVAGEHRRPGRRADRDAARRAQPGGDARQLRGCHVGRHGAALGQDHGAGGADGAGGPPGRCWSPPVRPTPSTPSPPPHVAPSASCGCSTPSRSPTPLSGGGGTCWPAPAPSKARGALRLTSSPRRSVRATAATSGRWRPATP